MAYMKVDENFKVTIVEEASDVEPSDLAGLPTYDAVIARSAEEGDDIFGERPSDPDNDVMDELEEQDERARHYGPSEAELQADSVTDEERDLAIAEGARLLEVHDEAHRRFEKDCERMGI